MTNLAPASLRQIRIGFDRTACFVTRAGIARYVTGLQRGLADLAARDLAILPVEWPVTNFEFAQPVRALKTLYRELVWGRFLAPAALRRMQATVLHSTSSLFIRRPTGVRHVVTLHDLSITRHPERFRPWQIRSWQARLPEIARADRVICISRFTADEAIRTLGLTAARIDVVPNGCDWHEGSRSFDETAPAESIPSEFFLFVGTLEPGKNLGLLRDVWTTAEREGRPLPPLLIVGVRREGVASEGTHPAGWHFLGYQPDSVLLYLYRRSLALVFPSTYEGFGLPIIEAMAQGCPVVCSPISSLPEVAGDAALMTPGDVPHYLGALRDLVAQPALRDDLRARGRTRAQQFTWRRCAELTAEVYRSASA